MIVSFPSYFYYMVEEVKTMDCYVETPTQEEVYIMYVKVSKYVFAITN